MLVEILKNDTLGIFKIHVNEGQAQGWSKFSKMTPQVFPMYLGPTWAPFGDPFLFRAKVGSNWGPIWRPKADITEAEGRLNGGLGVEPLWAEPPGI